MRLRNWTPLRSWWPWFAAVVSAVLLELPFPIAGPMPPWRGLIAFVALAPLLWAILSSKEEKCPRHPLRRAFLVAYLCGVLWYAGNCYWIYDTMLIHGGIPPMGAAAMLLAFSLVLGLYFGLFGLALRFIADRLSLRTALIAAPFLWTALDLAAARITSVPWDQLGYSQVDNSFLTHLAPVTGVYGITFLLVAINAKLAWDWLLRPEPRFRKSNILAPFIVILLAAGLSEKSPQPTPTATAVLIQPNLDVGANNFWNSPQLWHSHIGQLAQLSDDQCEPSIAGMPQTGAPTYTPDCSNQPPSTLLVWPEAPAFSFYELDPRFEQTMSLLARSEHTALVIGGIGANEAGGAVHDYNSAMLWASDGSRIGRYDKIHLVPFGEYVPYSNLFFFAHKLTDQVGGWTRGTDRKVFRIEDASGTAHRYGIFICYEAVFADEVRHFAKNGAEVLVNISDDGWYGDTSAPWQHFNMARMRAIENRRWLLRDANNGVTAVVDPYGTVRQSIPRHQVGALIAQYGFNSQTTFYTEHGDVFAWLCAILSLGFVVWAVNTRTAPKVLSKVRSEKEQK